jgi:non-specific serine/threonine protein kinase
MPSALTSLVGREEEAGQVRERLLAARLLTVTGTGGAGKTRLSMRVGEDAREDFPDGVWFVELASISDPELIPMAVAAVLDVRASAEQTLLTTLFGYLEEQQALLIVDNCELMIEGAAGFIQDLLQRCPGPRVLATSREVLGVNGETLWRVRSLSMPAAGEDRRAEDVERFEAVRLFVDRARAARGLHADRRGCRDRGSDLPPRRWHPPGAGTRGGARSRHVRRPDTRPLGRTLPPVDRRRARVSTSPTDPRGAGGLELPSAG